MKKKFLVPALLACLLAAVPASAAQWGEGCSPSQPYEGVPEIDLEERMGYIMLYPREKMPAEHYCDVLEMYLPREDVALGDGKLTLFEKDKGEIFSTAFTNEETVELRPLTEEEMEGLMWGSGICIEVYLPFSLKVGGDYYVHMEKGCMTAADGKVTSEEMDTDTSWKPVVSGEYGVSSLVYVHNELPEEPEEPGTEADMVIDMDTQEVAAEATAEDAAEASADTAEAQSEDGSEAPQTESAEEQPAVTGPAGLGRTMRRGDTFTFDLTLGGEAVSAVVYSDNGSVEFSQTEFTESGAVSGTVTGKDPQWGVVFLNDSGDILFLLTQ